MPGPDPGAGGGPARSRQPAPAGTERVGPLPKTKQLHPADPKGAFAGTEHSGGAFADGLAQGAARGAGLPRHRPSATAPAGNVASPSHTPEASARDDSRLSALQFLLGSLDWGSVQPDEAFSDVPTPVSLVFQVPWHLEQCLWLGVVIALDNLLHVVTLLPIRVASTVVSGVVQLLRGTGLDSRLHRAHLFDALRFATALLGVYTLSQFEVGWMYHTIRGESAPVKLYVLFNILEVADKLMASLGLEMVNHMHRAAVMLPNIRLHKHGQWSSAGWAAWQTVGLVVQVAGAAAVTAVHSAIMFVQLVCLSVALNSHSNALAALLISNNFVELKASVFKRVRYEMLFQTVCADSVERLNLLLFLGLTVVQDAGAADGMGARLRGACVVIVAELILDWVKHYFICKYNGFKPAVYDDGATILSHDVVMARDFRATTLDPTLSPSKRLGLATLPLACVIVRFLWLRFGEQAAPRLFTPSGIAFGLSCFCLLLSLKLFLNTAILAYARRFRALHALIEREAARATEAPDAAAEHSPLTRSQSFVVPPTTYSRVEARPPAQEERHPEPAVSAEQIADLSKLLSVNRFDLQPGAKRIP
ncbi:hypothetical protein FNF28_05327 [Cafeteria roenbergensis]|uniref:Uncharacterized protein n=1 Tax=Cafeteria roenbergensis TaxID=33653 RepID=A0A5A8D5T5_CAFRO|nr:hypothetical protein FNF28_05327 [Cafeteria roenbergensis]